MTELPTPPAPAPAESTAKISRPRLILLTCFVLALAAGAVGGFAIGGSHGGPHHDGHTTGWISEHLHLTAEQSQQIHDIWSQAFGPGAPGSPGNPGTPGGYGSDGHFERQKLDHERDKAVRALLNPKQQAAYDAIMDQYDQQMEKLSHQRHDRFAQAVEKTRAILTPEQRAEFDEFMKKRGEGHGGSGSHGGEHEAATEPGAEMN